MTRRGLVRAGDVFPPAPGAPLPAVIEYALTYDGYERLASEPQQLGRLLQPFLKELDRAQGVPDWAGIDLLRGALFYIQRQTHHWGDVPAHQEWQMRELVAAIISRRLVPTRRTSLKAYPRPTSWIDLDSEPRLASWNSSADPEQVAIRTYLDRLEGQVREAWPTYTDRLALALEVGLSEGTSLTTGGRDLDNYLYPVAQRLGGNRFYAAFAQKVHSATSRVGLAEVGYAADADLGFTVRATPPAEGPAWKEQVHAAALASVSEREDAGPVALVIAFTVAGARNWINLWKPAIDALGPVLGVEDPQRPFRPRDDRIVDLALHRTVHDSLGQDVILDVAWTFLAER